MPGAPELRLSGLIRIEKQRLILQQEHKMALMAGDLVRMEEIQIELDGLMRCVDRDDEEDGPLVEKAARDLIDQYGPKAADAAREQAEAADALQDTMSAEIWRRIAEAIERLALP